MIHPISIKLLAWYERQKRSLPWRDDPIPYHVWVAEIMAQQTRLETMLPYYERWLARFPTVQSLAAADLQEVLLLWEGLGYYQRARNLHAAAQKIVAQFEGRLPGSAEELRQLPGIGPYTAGAIASLAFGADEPAVDGNAVRVLTRLFDIQQPPNSSAGKQAIWQAARDILPLGNASAFNQGLMDLGARVCLPRNPHCASCPLAAECKANELGIQELRPLRTTAPALPIRHMVSLVLRRGSQVQLCQRPADALLGGMWEFPNIEIAPDVDGDQLYIAIKRELDLGAAALQPLPSLTHTYSHFQAQVRVFAADLTRQIAETPDGRACQWVDLNELTQRPMGKIDRSIANSVLDAVG